MIKVKFWISLLDGFLGHVQNWNFFVVELKFRGSFIMFLSFVPTIIAKLETLQIIIWKHIIFTLRWNRFKEVTTLP